MKYLAFCMMILMTSTSHADETLHINAMLNWYICKPICVTVVKNEKVHKIELKSYPGHNSVESAGELILEEQANDYKVILKITVQKSVKTKKYNVNPVIYIVSSEGVDVSETSFGLLTTDNLKNLNGYQGQAKRFTHKDELKEYKIAPFFSISAAN